MKEIKIARMNKEAILPTRKHKEDAGMDLYCIESFLVIPHNITIVHTGIVIKIPEGFVGLIKPKGGNMHLVGSGVVDAGYQGEILVKIANTKDSGLHFEKGQAIAQLLIIPVATPEIVEVSLEDILKVKTERGDTGGIHQKTLPYGKGWD
jgi:dUTP pyrophosphatase